jgi:diguanylate cyclase (GGDEF)-like protein
VFVKTPAGWVRAAGRVSASRELAWRQSLERLAHEPPAVLRLDDNGAGHATAVAIADVQPLALLIDGDWMSSAEVLDASSRVVSASLEAARTRGVNRDSARLLRRGYRLVSAFSDKADLDVLCKTIVENVASMFAADRVSLALFDAHGQTLRIRAAIGFPLSAVNDIKIAPGESVIGSVYTKRKSLTVTDVRTVALTHSHRNRYRTSSFVVAPLIHAGRCIGVLSVTDKRDRDTFSKAERTALSSVGALAAAALAGALAATEVKRLEHVASVDALTGLLNRGYLDRRLQQEVARSQRESAELAVLIADIDDFKTINDTRGHAVGDSVLKGVGDIIRSAVRVFDVCARYGGDEFAVLMPNTDRASALACAERIRARTSKYLADTAAEGAPPVTISIGVAVAQPLDNPMTLIERADQAMYEAKNGGKDRVHVHELKRGDLAFATANGAGAPPVRPVLALAPASMQLSYMLVADHEPARADAYRTLADRHRLGLLIARDGHDAVKLIEQFGPPTVLCVDMSAKEMRGVSLIESIHGRRPAITVALEASRDFREYALMRPAGLQLEVLRPAASPEAVIEVIERALRRRDAAATTVAQPPELAYADLDVEDISARVRQELDAPGVAVYLRQPDDGLLHARVNWSSPALMTRAHSYLPHVVERVMRTGTSVMAGDVGASNGASVTSGQPAADFAIAAAPVKHGDDVVGAICVFADAPLAAEADAVARFETLAASAFDDIADALNPTPADDRGDSYTLDNFIAETNAHKPKSNSAPPSDDDNEDLAWQPALLERQRGEFELARELARARREQRQMSIVLFDIAQREQGNRPPSRKDVNYDELLEDVVDTFVRAVRQSDLPIRWRGNELLLVLPGVSGADAHAVAERVRAAMQAGGRHRVAVSGGVAELEPEEAFGAVMRRARARVTEALGRGHNRVN